VASPRLRLRGPTGWADTSVASPAGPDAVSRLWWALRRYAGVVIGATLLTAVAVAVIAPPAEGDEYHAAALVVAQELDGVRAEHLPRMAEAIFSGNNVAQETVRRTGLPIRSDELVPDHAWVEVVEGTVVMRVIGAAEDPRLAASIATTAAETLVDELGRLGPGVGAFSLQETAPVPEEPAPQPRHIPPFLLGLVGGAVLGVGLAFLLLVLRRPVIEVDEALEIIDDPLIGVLELSRAGHFDDVEDVAGGIALVDELYPRRREVEVLVAANEATTRSQVSVALARVLATLGPVLFVTSRDRAGRRARRFLRSVENVQLLDAAEERSAGLQQVQGHRPLPVVADGHPSVRLMLPSSIRPVLVVREGISAQRLRRAVRHLQPQQARGILWVASRGGPATGILRRLVHGRWPARAPRDGMSASGSPPVEASEKDPTAPKDREEALAGRREGHSGDGPAGAGGSVAATRAHGSEAGTHRR
jgi:hypothetical protein